MELRLGDVIDDYCIKCRRLTNHSVVSLMEGEVAKVRCRSCYHEHTYLHEQAPPSRKELKKAELLAVAKQDEGQSSSTDPQQAEESAETEAAATAADALPSPDGKGSRTRARKA